MAETIDSLHHNLSKVIAELNVPKSQFNKFGNYNYRSCEDIVEAVKPWLKKYGLRMLLDDEMVQVGERYYIKATVFVTNGDNTVSASAFAREAEEQKGMSDSQITGSASSYARKYALNGMFCIDDTKDADTNEHREQSHNSPALEKSVVSEEPSQKQMLMLRGLISQSHSFFDDENAYNAFKEQKISEATTKAKASNIIKQLTERLEAKKAETE